MGTNFLVASVHESMVINVQSANQNLVMLERNKFLWFLFSIILSDLTFVDHQKICEK